MPTSLSALGTNSLYNCSPSNRSRAVPQCGFIRIARMTNDGERPL